jgi:hypothetical protein
LQCGFGAVHGVQLVALESPQALSLLRQVHVPPLLVRSQYWPELHGAHAPLGLWAQAVSELGHMHVPVNSLHCGFGAVHGVQVVALESPQALSLLRQVHVPPLLVRSQYWPELHGAHAPLGLWAQALSLLGHMHVPVDSLHCGFGAVHGVQLVALESPQALSLLRQVHVPPLLVRSQYWPELHGAHAPLGLWAQAASELGHIHAPFMQFGVAPEHDIQEPGDPQELTVLSHTHW